MAEKERLLDELTERRRRSLMIRRFIEEVKGFTMFSPSSPKTSDRGWRM
ncbi:MAG: hypothetical protein ACI4NI_06130 [Candidatus Ornithospirochaeta sp.]